MNREYSIVSHIKVKSLSPSLHTHSSLSIPPATGASVQSQATSSLTTASSSKEELRNKAPVVPFGMDLFHWGSTDELEPTMTR